MSLTRVNPRSYARLLALFRDGKRNYSSVVTKEDEYTETPEYPPSTDLSHKGKIKSKQKAWHDEIKNLKTVEEKLMKINMPRYYGWKSLILKENYIPYNSESLAQYITRTHIFKERGLPKYYDNITRPDQIDASLNQVKKQIEDVILFEHISRKREHELDSLIQKDPVQMADIIGDAIVRQINRILLATLSPELPHLLEVQEDYEPRIEAFWFAGGMNPPKDVVAIKRKSFGFKEFANDPVDRRVQYAGTPTLQIRHDFPLNEIIDLNESENPDFTVPEFKFDPGVLGYRFDYLHGTNIPGFWPGDPSEFGVLSYHRRGHIDNRKPTFKDEEDALDVQAIYASYAWLLSQACYQGFSTFTDLTYPLVTQTVITNGQLWSFYVYQMNTTLVHSEYSDENPRKNLCWTTGPLKLFEKIEDGKLIGFNDDVLKKLIIFYQNVPQNREGVEMKPYLGKTEQKIADIKHRERRAWLEKAFKHMYTNRPRHLLKEEINHWEYIYKLKFKTRPLDKRRKKWEYGITNSSRKYDDHALEYIPKILRPGGPKSRIKFRKTYYP